MQLTHYTRREFKDVWFHMDGGKSCYGHAPAVAPQLPEPPKRELPATKPCPLHPGEDLVLRGRGGFKFYSHFHRDASGGFWCKGYNYSPDKWREALAARERAS